MAMTKCRECGAAVSTKAAACPSCGAARPRRTSLFTWLVAAVVVPSCVGGIYFAQQQTQRGEELAAKAEAAKTPAERASEAAQKARDDADYSRAVASIRTLKQSSKNPASFDLSDAQAMPSGAICFSYTGTNSFNATVQGNAVLTPDDKLHAGGTTAVATAWTKYCAGKAGRSVRHARRAA